jgi:hypothetical protein
MAGFLIAMAGFARAQSWAIAGAIGLTLIFTSAKSLKKLVYLCSGYTLGFGLMLGYLFSNRAIEQWWLQSIYWPTQIYPALGQGNNYNRFQAILYIVEGISLLLLIFIASQICKRHSVRSATIFIATATFISLILGFYIPTIDNLPIRYRVLFGEPFERILVSPYYLSVLIVIWISYKQLRKTQTDRNPAYFLVATVGAISLIQLYPQSDVMHLWWIAPILLPSFAIFVSDLKVTSEFLPIVFERTILVFSIFGVVLGLNFALSDWKEFKSPALEGTYASADKVNGLRIYDDIAKNAIPKKSSFDCHDGIYSVLSGEYLPIDEWYVSWGFPKSVIPELGEIRFICGKSYEYAESEALRLGWILTRFNQSKSNPEASLATLKKP